MVYKYKKEDITDINKTWNEKNIDLDAQLFNAEGIKVKSLSLDSTINGAQGKIDKRALIDFGTNILNDMDEKPKFYLLSIPSLAVFEGSHAVAMSIDHKNKKIYYHDSHGEDMRKEIKDFTTLLLPEYQLDINLSKQQADVTDGLDFTKNDNSCCLLSKYNLRDMWYKISGKEEKICDFSSQKARSDAWDRLKDIRNEDEKKHKPE